MKKTAKVTLAVAGLFFTVILVAVIAVVTLDPNDHKEWIAEKFQQQTGRTLSFAGDIGLTLYPWFGLSLNQVSIGNTAGFEQEFIFSAESLDLRVKLLPALRNHFEIDTVQLYGAELNLTINEAGVANWVDLSSAPVAQESGPGDDDAGLPLSNIVLGGVDIQNATVRFKDLSKGTAYNVSHLTFTTDELVYGVPIDLTLSAAVTSTRPEISGDLVLDGTVNYDIDNGRYQLAPLNLQVELAGDNIPGGSAEISLTTSVTLDLENDTLRLSDLELNGLNTRVLATVNGRNVTKGSPVYTSDFTLSGQDLSILFAVLEIEPLASQLAALDDRTFELETSVTLDVAHNSVDVSRLAATLLGANLEGAFQASNIGSENAIVRGDLNASGPDLPLVVEVLGQISGGRESRLSEAGRRLRTITDKEFFVNTQFDADLQAGNVIISTLDARLLGASLQGRLTASDVQSDSPLVEGALNAEGPDLPLLIQTAGWFQGGTESTVFQYGERFDAISDKSFVATAEFDVDLQQGNIEMPVLTGSAMGLRFEGNISTQNMTDRNGTVDGSFHLDGSNLAEVMASISQQELGDVLQSLAMEIQLSGSRNNLVIDPLQLELIVAAERIPNSPVTLQMKAATRINMDQETLTVDSFSLKGLGLDATGRINASGIFDTPAFDGRLELASFNPRQLLQQLNQSVPETADNEVLQQLALSTSFDGTMDSIKLSELELLLDDSMLRGEVAVIGFAEPAVEFDLAVDQLNVDRYLQPDTTESQSDPASSTATRIPVDQLQNLNVRGQLKIGSLSVADMDLADLSLTLSAVNGQLDLAPVSSNLYQGSFEGSVRVSVNDGIPRAQVEADLRQIDLEPLLQDLMNATYVSGHGNLQIAVTGQGADTDAMLQSLNGTGRIDLENGVLTGVDVANVLGQLETMLRSRQPGELQRGEQTAFDSFSGTLAISDGVISTRDLLIKSPGFAVTGRGTLLDLSNDAIDFSMVTSVDSSTATRDSQEYDIGGYDLPIACTGTVSEPRCLPDGREILRGVVVREVQRRVGDILERAIGIEKPPAPDVDNSQDPQSEPEPEPEPINPRDELINRALDRLFR
ncbi:MAG: AsmA family protein [Gammaproteobacteria bacterium]|nr:AsmA family protein [Gammaproteobacteria bacterium]